MDSITVKLATSAAVPAVTALTAAAKWLDKRYNIASDIAQIQCLRRNAQYFVNLQQRLGDDDWSFYHVLHDTQGTNDMLEAFVFEGRSWTYAEMRGEIGRLATKFAAMGVTNRTVVAMYINNSPEFIFAWWALYKLGAVPAPINTSISKEPFRHCLRISDARMLIASYELIDAAVASLGSNMQASDGCVLVESTQVPALQKLVLYDYGTYQSRDSVLDAEKFVLNHDSLPLPPDAAEWPAEARPKVAVTDASQYLFTSGTTGLPKAAIWPAGYSMMACGPYRWPMMFQEQRRFYISTPMFHGGAAFAVLPATHATSGTVILARKFSVRNFWSDIRRTRANGMFYIGEMVRFLVQAPRDPHNLDEKQHPLKLIYGLGIAAPVWKAFRNRFGVPWIVEYYSASEATASICNSNWENDEGCGKVAHWGPLMRSKWFGQDAFYIIRIDLETGEVIRDPRTGFCQKCDWDEVGEGISRIRAPLQRSHDYVGPEGQAATEKKLLRDVFEKGDIFFRAGDAMSMNSRGYIAFHDRLGDTFRAKGHNISTTEVEMAFLNHPHIQSVNVYSIPMTKYGYEGQLGCAAITISEETITGPGMEQVFANLEQWLVQNGGLAPYAVPRFIRVMSINTASPGARDLGGRDDLQGERVSLIMKKLKTGLRNEGLNISAGTDDRLFWIQREGTGFIELQPSTLEQLKAGKAKL